MNHNNGKHEDVKGLIYYIILQYIFFKYMEHKDLRFGKSLI